MITEDNLEDLFVLTRHWPPESEKERLQTYDENLLLWQGKHEKVYWVLTKLYSTHEMDPMKVLMKINWHKRLSTFWADLLISEKPHLKAGQEDPTTGEPPAEQTYLEVIIKRLQFWRSTYALILDMSRYGVGVPKVYADEGAPSKLQIVPPKNWFPIIDADGWEPTAHLIAWVNTQGFQDHIQRIVLNIEIHRIGSIEYRKYLLNSAGNIISAPFQAKIQQTGYDNFLVLPIVNSLTSENICGADDYQDLDPLIKRLEITLTRVGKILDAHSEPAFAVPETAMGPKDPLTGEQSFNVNRKVFPLEENEKAPQYITWNGQLTGAFSLIDHVMQQFYDISETCKAAFEPDTIGRALSGTALRLLMTAPLKKAERIKLVLDPGIRAIIRAVSFLDVKNKVKGAVMLDDISATWYDGLPIDFSEDVTSYVALKAARSVTDERMQNKLFGLEGAELRKEVEELHAENGQGVISSPGSMTISNPDLRGRLNAGERIAERRALSDQNKQVGPFT